MYSIIIIIFFNFTEQRSCYLLEASGGLVYQGDMGKGSGVTIVPKLKREHIKLTSFSKMRVDLAAQVHIYRYTNTD